MQSPKEQAKDIVNLYYQPLTFAIPELARTMSTPSLWNAAKEMARFNLIEEIKILQKIQNEIENL